MDLIAWIFNETDQTNFKLQICKWILYFQKCLSRIINGIYTHLEPWMLLQLPIQPQHVYSCVYTNHTLENLLLKELQSIGIWAVSALYTSLCAKKPNMV